MECILLGIGGMMPMPGRPLTALAVRTGGAAYLLDCGEGTQVPYKAYHVGMRPLRLVALTHLHADHCLGLPGLLMLRSQMEDPEPLTIVGPRGIRRFTRNVIRDLACRITFEIAYTEIDPQVSPAKKEPLPVVYEDELVRLFYLPLRHTTFCVGYRLEEHQRPGRFDPAKAAALGLPPGPAYGRLQAGVAVESPDGTPVRPDQVLGPPRRGRHLAFVTDTAPCKNIYRLLDQVDLAFIEGMFLPDHADEARQKKHLTVDDSARIASRAGASRAILVHLSPRYDASQIPQVNAAAATVSKTTRLGKEGERFSIKLPD